MLTSLFSIIFRLADDTKMDESMFLAIQILTLQLHHQVINFPKHLTRALIIDLSTTIPFSSCHHCTYLIHLFLFNYPSYFLSTKILMSVTYVDNKEKEIYKWTDVIYPQHIPHSYSQYMNCFAYPLKVKREYPKVDRILEEEKNIKAYWREKYRELVFIPWFYCDLFIWFWEAVLSATKVRFTLIVFLWSS